MTIHNPLARFYRHPQRTSRQKKIFGLQGRIAMLEGSIATYKAAWPGAHNQDAREARIVERVNEIIILRQELEQLEQLEKEEAACL
jgi:hypothetical protein